MHVNVGEVDFASHAHVPTVSVQSHVSPDVPSHCMGHAAAVFSQRLSATGKNGCISGLMSHGFCAPLTFCRLPRELVGSKLLDDSQMQWSPAESGTEARHAQSSTKIDQDCPSCSI